MPATGLQAIKYREQIRTYATKRCGIAPVHTAMDEPCFVFSIAAGCEDIQMLVIIGILKQKLAVIDARFLESLSLQ